MGPLIDLKKRPYDASARPPSGRQRRARQDPPVAADSDLDLLDLIFSPFGFFPIFPQPFYPTPILCPSIPMMCTGLRCSSHPQGNIQRPPSDPPPPLFLGYGGFCGQSDYLYLEDLVSSSTTNCPIQAKEPCTLLTELRSSLLTDLASWSQI